LQNDYFAFSQEKIDSAPSGILTDQYIYYYF